jgi:hypothetical protein
MENQTIVIARYNEDIRWCLPFINFVKVYNKGADNLDYIPEDRVEKCENLGREGGTYLKFIIDNYENLPKFTIFLQGNPFDHINSANKRRAYYDLLYIIKEQKPYHFKYISTWLIDVPGEWVDEYCQGMTTITHLFGGKEKLRDRFSQGYTYGSGAMFVVHKDKILQHSKEFWIELYNHFQEVSPPAGYGLEKLWRFLFE